MVENDPDGAGAAVKGNRRMKQHHNTEYRPITEARR